MHTLKARAVALLLLTLSLLQAPLAAAADVVKANNADALGLGSSWVGGSAPGTGDVAVWNSTVTTQNVPAIDANFAMAGIRIANPGGIVGISPTTLNSGTVTANASTDTIAYTGTDVVAGNVVSFSQSAGSIPGGLAAGQLYFVVNVDSGSKTYQVSDTVGGLPINLTSNGSNVSNSVRTALSLGSSGIDMTTATRDFTLLSAPVSLTGDQTWTVASGRRLDSNNNSNFTGVDVLGNGHSLTIAGGGTVDLGSFSGSGGITKNGTGSLVMMSASYDFAGDLMISGGTVNIKAASSFGSSASRIEMNGGTLTAQANNARNFARSMVVTGDAAFFNNNSTNSGAQSYTFGEFAIGSHTFTVTANGTTDGTLMFGATTLSGSPTFNVGSRVNNVLVLGAIGEIGGSRGITKSGIGTLRLSGTSSYSGTTTIADGILALTGAGSLPAAGPVSNAGTLDISGTTTSGTAIGSLAGSGSVALGGKTLILGDATSTTFSGVVSGIGGSLVKQGLGTLTLSGSNTFDGALTVAAGTLQAATLNDAGAVGPLGAGSSAVVLGGSGTSGTLAYTGSTAATTRPFRAAAGGTAAFVVTTAGTTLTLSGLVDGDGDKSFGGAGSTVMAGGLSGSGTVTKTGTGALTLTLTGHAGGYDIQAGRLNLNAASAIGNATTLALGTGIELDNASANAVTINNSTVAISLGASLDFVGTRDLNLGVGTVTLASSIAVDVAAGTLTFAGNVVDGGSAFGITKSGAGTLVLSGLSTGGFTGNSVIDAGELYLSGTSVLGAGAGTTLTVNPGGTLRIGATASTGGVTIVDNGGTKVVESLQNSGQTFAVSTSLTADDALFNGVQTIDAGVTVSASQDWLGSVPGGPTAGRIVLEDAAVLASTNAIDINVNKGIMLAGASATFDTTAGTIFVRPVISGSGQLVKVGSNGFRLYNTANDYTGGTVAREGTLGIYGDGSLGAVAGALLLDGGTVNSAQGTSGQTITIDPTRLVRLANGKTSGLAATAGSTLAYAGVLAEAAAGVAAGLRIGSATQGGTVLLGGANTFAGDTTIAGGTLKLGSGGSFASSPRIIVGDAGSSGAVLDLTAKTTFAIGATQTLIGKGKVLLGQGTTLTINGLLSPGNSPGLLTYDGGGTVNLAGTTLLEFAGATRGAGYDAIEILNSSTLNLGGVLELDFNQTFADGTVFNLFTPDGTSSLTGNFSSLSMVGSAYADLTFTDDAGLWTTTTGLNNQSMTFDSSTGNLTILVVPEPAALPLLAVAAAGCGLVLRRRSLSSHQP
jgi:fibronectin-binding autotransporter adhesin